MAAAQPVLAPGAAEVLTKGLLRAATRLGLGQGDIARVIGVSPASVSRLGRGRSVDPATKEGELALLLLRVYRSLDALVGGDEQAIAAWFHAHNHHLGGVPAERVRRAEGLVHVAEYLDAMRGHL